MPGKGRQHFDSYTPQNRVKHAILTKYFSAYLKALSKTVEAFHYIDGFAGPGEYADQHSGSPLYAIQLLAVHPKRGTASFVENDPQSCRRLEAAIAGAPGLDRLLEAPWLRNAEFSECLGELLTRPVLRRFRRVAAFAFVDPCGLKGLYLEDLAKILRLQFAECLVFLNYDGLSRWLGGVRAGSHSRASLDRFFGSSSAATEALECWDMPAPAREAQLLAIYVDALLRDSGARFILPFRFRASDRNRTSHYLIHLSQHELAFKIMKDVMRSEASENDVYGSFGFIPDDELTGQGALFQPNAEHARAEIMDELRKGSRPVKLFTERWPLRPTDMLVAKEYRQLLLELEEERVIEVVDGKTGQIVTASKRPRRLGRPTLSDDYHVRLHSGRT